MTDLEELFRPVIEDGTRYREPIEAIETRARARHSLRRRRQRVQYRLGAGFVAVAVIAAAVAVVSTRRDAGSDRSTPLVTTKPTSTDVAPTVPPGWHTYDYGLARISVPPDYTASRGTVCPAADGPVLELTPTGHTADLTCLPGSPTVTLAPVASNGLLPAGRTSSVNGIQYISVPSHCPPQLVPPSSVPRTAPVCEPSIWVPSLDIVISFAFTHRDNVADIDAILGTLTHSTYARLLQKPFGPPPASWKTIALGGYVARVPASWAVVRDANYCGPVANTASIESYPVSSECPPPGVFVVPPRDSGHFVRADDGRLPHGPPLPTGAVVVRHNGLRFARTPASGGLDNQIHFTIDGPHGRLDVTLTLGLNASIARGILGSLKMPGAP